MKNLPLLDPPAIVRSAKDLASIAKAVRSDYEAVKKSNQSSVERARSAGEKLASVWDELKADHRLVKWLSEEANIPRRTAANFIIIHQEWDKCATVAHLGVRGVLEFLRSGETGEEDEGEEEDAVPESVTLDQWNEMDKRRRAWLLSAKGKATFNAQGSNENIEWALWSWNPVTGCLHGCPYCYARDIAERFYTQKFAPSLWPNRLAAPQNTPFPEDKAAEWMGHKNVFVCSMADLFGRWVPAEWIEAVLDQCRKAPQWNFLFLTKFPVRMAEFDFPENAWVGTTVDCQARVANAERSFRKVKAGRKWLSIEPLIEPLKFSDLAAFDWVVIGGASQSSQTPAWHPPRRWVLDLEDAARSAGVPFYEKSNLWCDRVKGYPGDEPYTEPQEAPKALRYLPTPETK